MTDTLKQAIREWEQVPEGRQESIARLVLHETAEDRKWAESTATHEEKLAGLVAEVGGLDQSHLPVSVIPAQAGIQTRRIPFSGSF